LLRWLEMNSLYRQTFVLASADNSGGRQQYQKVSEYVRHTH
jgi:hypothetical protein